MLSEKSKFGIILLKGVIYTIGGLINIEKMRCSSVEKYIINEDRWEIM